jgi:FixJ family two-component response regulator
MQIKGAAGELWSIRRSLQAKYRSRRMKAQESNTVPQQSIVIVDDDPAVLNSLKFSLEVEGFAVLAYANGTQLLASDDWRHSGCLVIDYGLPDTDGYELLKEIRKGGGAMPAILITTHPSLYLRNRASAAGIPIVEKPLLGNALSEAIRRALVPRI